jgi:hypothetical protein
MDQAAAIERTSKRIDPSRGRSDEHSGADRDQRRAWQHEHAAVLSSDLLTPCLRACVFQHSAAVCCCCCWGGSKGQKRTKEQQNRPARHSNGRQDSSSSSNHTRGGGQQRWRMDMTRGAAVTLRCCVPSPVSLVPAPLACSRFEPPPKAERKRPAVRPFKFGPRSKGGHRDTGKACSTQGWWFCAVLCAQPPCPSFPFPPALSSSSLCLSDFAVAVTHAPVPPATHRNRSTWRTQVTHNTMDRAQPCTL